MKAAGLLVVATLLAGCAASGPEAPSLARAPPSEPATPTPPEQDVTAQGEPDSIKEPVLWDAMIPAVALVCPDHDAFGCAGYARWMEPYEIKARNLTHAKLTLTWAPSSPTTQELGIAVYRCWNDCNSWQRIGPFVKGTSPLTYETTLTPVHKADERAIIYVWILPRTPSPLYTYANTDQAFHLEGTMHAELTA